MYVQLKHNSTDFENYSLLYSFTYHNSEMFQITIGWKIMYMTPTDLQILSMWHTSGV